MNEMIKRRKDEGFTLIELMIVIAVIGILAVVLVPKFGSIKTSAKNTGVITNFRSVTANVHAVKLTKDDDTAGEVATKVNARLVKDFADNNVLVNPYTKKDDISVIVSNAAVIVGDVNASAFSKPSATGKAEYIGAIVVLTSVISSIPTVTVYGCDETGKLIEGLTEVIEP